MNGAMKGKNSIKEGISFMQSFDIVIHPRCVNVIDECSTFSYKIDKDTDMVLPILSEKKNHTIDSCMYMLEGLRRAGVKAVGVEKKVRAYSQHGWMVMNLDW